MNMASFKHLMVMAVLLVGLAFSGCVGDSPEKQAAEEPAGEELATADEILEEESVVLTDAEIEDLESEMDELAALLEDIDSVENFSVEEL